MTWRYTIGVHPHDREIMAARLWAAGAIGVWEQPDALVGWFGDEDGQAAPVPGGGTWETEPEVDWQASWKATISPVLAGPVALVPSWLVDDFQPGDEIETIVVLEPGQAFGSGHHATTVMCTEDLAAMDLRGRDVFDVGTGTGVLAIVAALRGARRIVAVDIDGEAVDVSVVNAENNHLRVLPVATQAETQVETATGGAADGPGASAIEVGIGSADAVVAQFDVVVANLMTDVITALAGDLFARIRPGGHLVASGIDARRGDRPAARLEEHGLQRVSWRELDGWIGAVWRRPLA